MIDKFWLICFFSLGDATSLEEGKLCIQKSDKLRLKIDLVSYPARAEGLVNVYNRTYIEISQKYENTGQLETMFILNF